MEYVDRNTSLGGENTLSLEWGVFLHQGSCVFAVCLTQSQERNHFTIVYVMPQTPFSSPSWSPKRSWLAQHARECFPLRYVALIKSEFCISTFGWGQKIHEIPSSMRLSQMLLPRKAQKASSLVSMQIRTSENLRAFLLEPFYIAQPRCGTSGEGRSLEIWAFLAHTQSSRPSIRLLHCEQAFTVQTAKAVPGPSLCTIPHPAGSLLSCVISADAAIEALREIFTIVLSVSASSHLQIRINTYKIIHHFAQFTRV